MSDELERRVRQVRSRVAARAWGYRQRRHARGVWMRLRRILADAQAAYVISESDAALLVAEGFRAEAVGRELEPAKIILFVPAARVARLTRAREIPVSLEVELLEAPALALVRFP